MKVSYYRMTTIVALLAIRPMNKNAFQKKKKKSHEQKCKSFLEKKYKRNNNNKIKM